MLIARLTNSDCDKSEVDILVIDVVLFVKLTVTYCTKREFYNLISKSVFPRRMNINSCAKIEVDVLILSVYCL